MDSLCTTGLYFYFSKDIHASAVKEIIEYLSKIPDLKIHYPFDLKNYSINNRLAKDIEEKGLEKIIIAGDSPGMIKSLFSKAITKNGGNPENIVLADFNEYNISFEDEKEKAIALLLGAIYDLPMKSLQEMERCQ
jgi:heterodisulfide reductase subunit A-like polyferredoxin